MKTKSTRALRALLGACALMAGTAVATPPAVTSQKGAAALITMYALRTELPRQIDALTFSTQELADHTLRLIAAATTPAAVRATPAGVAVACPLTGSVIARISARTPYLLKLQWLDCTHELDGVQHVLNGTGEIVLLEQTFTPNAVASIRLGDGSADLVEKLVNLFSEAPPDTRLRNLRMTGYIPMARADEYSAIYGTGIYQLTGFVQVRSFYGVAVPDAGDQLFESTYTVTAEPMLVQRTLESDGSRRELRMIGGSILEEWFYPDTPAEPTHTDIFKVEPGAVRLRELVNTTTYDRTFELDGTVHIKLPAFAHFDCHSKTDFDFRTTVPLHFNQPVFGPDLFDSGEILVNGTATARFSPGYAFGYEATHVDFSTRQGNFAFDVLPDGGWVELLPAAACTP